MRATCSHLGLPALAHTTQPRSHPHSAGTHQRIPGSATASAHQSAPCRYCCSHKQNSVKRLAGDITLDIRQLKSCASLRRLPRHSRYDRYAPGKVCTQRQCHLVQYKELHTLVCLTCRKCEVQAQQAGVADFSYNALIYQGACSQYIT